MATKKVKARKQVLADEFVVLLKTYSKCFMVGVDNVGSNQLHEIRKSMRGKAVIYCGKNTQMRRVLKILEAEGMNQLEAIRQKCKMNVALVFTNNDLVEIRDLIKSNRMPAAARVGSPAQRDVMIPKGITTLEPSMTAFLQALNIGSKITKGAIEIIADVHLLTAGKKVQQSEAALLNKMNITPFAFGLEIKYVYDNGSIFEPDVLDISDDTILAAFSNGCKNVAALSIQLGRPTVVSVPYSILLAFKNLLAMSVATEYNFAQAKEIKAFLAK